MIITKFLDEQSLVYSKLFPNQALKVNATKTAVGGSFGGSFDSNKYTSTTAVSGSVTQSNGKLVVTTGTTANGTAKVTSKTVRLQAGKENYFSANLLVDSGQNNNLKKWGLLSADGNNGFYFRLGNNAASLSIVSLKAGVETAVALASWNRVAGVNFTFDSNSHNWQIFYSASAVYFFIDQECVHAILNTTDAITSFFDFQLFASSVNSSGALTNTGLTIFNWSIQIINDVPSMMDYYIIGNVAETRTLRSGSTRLVKVSVLSKATGAATLSIYDALSATGTPIVIDLTSLGSYDLNLEFFTGLTYVTSAALSQNIVITFE